MRIMSANLNGIRSAYTKGFFPWFLEQDIDVLCIQETKAQEHQLRAEIVALPGYTAFFHDAEKPGYSGTAIYTRKPPDRVVSGIGLPDLDSEGRYLQADWGDLSIASIYAPSGTSGEARQAQKERYLARLTPFYAEMLKSGRRYLCCGDMNIAHKPIDLKNWRANQNTPGFLPHERAWLDHLFDEIGMCDAFRLCDQSPEQYTWWSMRAGARAKNVGWRIDYHIVTPNLRNAVRSAVIARDPFFSDHAPLTIDYDI
jgi:exodeoxyribonuclease-3